MLTHPARGQADVMLVQGLTFTLKQGQSLLLTGHNGAGKSSIFRCLGGLWRIPKGKITRPGGDEQGLALTEVFYIPQKPYNVWGTLQDQMSESAAASFYAFRCVSTVLAADFLCLSSADDAVLRSSQPIRTFPGRKTSPRTSCGSCWSKSTSSTSSTGPAHSTPRSTGTCVCCTESLRSFCLSMCFLLPFVVLPRYKSSPS